MDSFYLTPTGPSEVKIYPEVVISYQMILKQLSVTSTIFLSLFSRLQEHTNPTILMDAKQ